MEDEARHLAVGAADELDLGVDDFQEEPGFGLGEDLEFRLPRGLGEEVVSLAGDGDREGGRQLVGCLLYTSDAADE